jgi:phosphohistidine phosphatase
VPLLLDLIRHGVAAPADHHGDFERPLTPEGELAIRRLSESLAGHAQRPTRIFSSPLRRARETAQNIARGLGLQGPIEELAELGAGHDASDVLEALAALGITEGHVALVGHQPQLGRLAALLSGCGTGLAPGELVRIECSDGPRPHSGRMVLDLRSKS